MRAACRLRAIKSWSAWDPTRTALRRRLVAVSSAKSTPRLGDSTQKPRADLQSLRR
jgi:hypothetical protein